jgi:hypothetical protein
MRLAIVIVVAFVVMRILQRRNNRLYFEEFACDKFNEMAVQTHNILHAPPKYKPLEASYGFINYSANLWLKFFHFIIFSAVVFFFGSNIILFWILTSVYAFFMTVAFWGYTARKNFYCEIEDDFIKNAYRPILKASICIPIYQVVITALLWFV